jgi:hypothetical protein
VLSNCQWDRGEVHAAFRQPFDLLSKTIASAATTDAQQANIFTGSPVWLGFVEAFRTFCLSPPADLGGFSLSQYHNVRAVKACRSNHYHHKSLAAPI